MLLGTYVLAANEAQVTGRDIAAWWKFVGQVHLSIFVEGDESGKHSEDGFRGAHEGKNEYGLNTGTSLVAEALRLYTQCIVSIPEVLHQKCLDGSSNAR